MGKVSIPQSLGSFHACCCETTAWFCYTFGSGPKVWLQFLLQICAQLGAARSSHHFHSAETGCWSCFSTAFSKLRSRITKYILHILASLLPLPPTCSLYFMEKVWCRGLIPRTGSAVRNHSWRQALSSLTTCLGLSVASLPRWHFCALTFATPLLSVGAVQDSPCTAPLLTTYLAGLLADFELLGKDWGSGG